MVKIHKQLSHLMFSFQFKLRRTIESLGIRLAQIILIFMLKNAFTDSVCVIAETKP